MIPIAEWIFKQLLVNVMRPREHATLTLHSRFCSNTFGNGEQEKYKF